MSWQMGAVGLYLRATRKRELADPAGGAQLLAAPKGPIAPPTRRVRDLMVTQHDIAGAQVHALSRRGVDREHGPRLIYLHGGAFVSRIVSQHWNLVVRLALDLDVTVLVPHYGLAPQHTAAEARELVELLLRAFAAEGRPVYPMGDSAGGNLALLGAQYAAAQGHANLHGLTLIAPWLDLTMANPDIDEVEQRDPWLARAAMHEVARVWADGTPLDDPSVSPLFGCFEGLPPVDLWVGDRDVCLPDCQLLRDALAEVGTVTYHEEPDALHVYPLLPTPEGRRARRELIAHVRSLL